MPFTTALLALLAALAGGGLLYQVLGSRRDAERNLPPGQLLPVNRHRLHLWVLGDKDPTVVLEAGIGASSLSWRLVHTAAARFARVCAYDRAGLGWSEAGRGGRSAQRSVAELRRALSGADLTPPYVLVGHSFGAYLVRLFAALHPAVLVSPKFLFRMEHDPAAVAPGTPYRLSDVELASRVSFFLWSSIPDDELLDVAVAGQLRDPAVLERQVRRMVRDPRAHALVENFAGQWLYLRNLRTVAPNANLFPDFDDNLREALRRETELFFEYQLREDRSVLELLTANYTFLNDRLAKHYEIPNVYGSHFRRVAYPDNRRAGLLGHGSILTVTSYPNRTSPVVRGKWLLENLLGAPPPPPPANVPALRENDEGGVPATVRERMEQHRAHPVCASCHARMDPLGFALENFNAVGQWRSVDHEAGVPIDASGTLPDGTRFETAAEFRAALLSEPWRSEFVTTATERLLTYALGRGLEYYDQPVVRQIVREAAASDTRWSAIVLGIVESPPFQMRLAHGSGSPSAP